MLGTNSAPICVVAPLGVGATLLFLLLEMRLTEASVRGSACTGVDATRRKRHRGHEGS